MTITEFLTRYDNKETFSENELQDLYWGDVDDEGHEVYEIETIHYNKRRWSRVECRYLQIDDRYFCFSGDIGLTECQDDAYLIQPYEVKRNQKTVVVNVWEEISRD